MLKINQRPQIKSSVIKKKTVNQNVGKNLKEKGKSVENDHSKDKRDFLKNFKIPKHVQTNGRIEKLITDLDVKLHLKPFKIPAKPECPQNLNVISHGDIIMFFKEDQALKEHWQKIMDTGPVHL